MKDMNTISKCLLTVIATTVTIAGCIYAGKVEYEDEVLSGMSAEKSTSITRQSRTSCLSRKM